MHLNCTVLYYLLYCNAMRCTRHYIYTAMHYIQHSLFASNFIQHISYCTTQIHVPVSILPCECVVTSIEDMQKYMGKYRCKYMHKYMCIVQVQAQIHVQELNSKLLKCECVGVRCSPSHAQASTAHSIKSADSEEKEEGRHPRN